MLCLITKLKEIQSIQSFKTLLCYNLNYCKKVRKKTGKSLKKERENFYKIDMHSSLKVSSITRKEWWSRKLSEGKLAPKWQQKNLSVT